MYGWRGRLGLILPSSNSTNEPEFARWLPDGVSLHAARMRLEDVDAESLGAMADEVERCADLLATADADAIAYGCTTGSLVHGPGHDEEIEARIESVAGVPAVATAAAIKRAFARLGLERLAITTPYVTELNSREVEFLTDAGYEVAAVDGLGIDRNTEIGAQQPETAYRRARQLPVDDADGVFLSCTNYRTFEVIPALEADLGVPVVTSNQATLWNALAQLGVTADIDDLGRLFATDRA